MNISQYTIQHLAKAVCGDSSYTPYLRGFELEELFRRYGVHNQLNYFPSRWKFTENMLHELNGTNSIKKIIEEIVDPRRFIDSNLNVDIAAKNINTFLKFENCELREVSGFYKLSSIDGTLVESVSAKSINHAFINEQIDKCHKKITEEDFNGAITNSRSLIEAIFIEIIERSEGNDVKNDGDVENLWKKVKKIMKMEIDKETLPDFVFQILSGIDTSIKGLAGLSNNGGDRHATKFNTKKHHAKLAVNLAMTIADFLMDSWEYQSIKKPPTK